LKRQLRAPRVLISDKLRSYAAAKREIMPGVEHRQHKSLNSRAKNSHQPTTRADHETLQVATAGATISSIHDQIANVSPFTPIKTLPPNSIPPVVKPSQRGPRSLLWRWPRNHPCRRPPLNRSRLSQFHRRQVDGASWMTVGNSVVDNLGRRQRDVDLIELVREFSDITNSVQRQFHGDDLMRVRIHAEV
jgi:putative transposase